MTDAATWLLGWFKKKGPVPGQTVDEQLRTNYFESGLIDSLGLIEMIAAVEEHFDIHFSQNQFQDRRFSTIGGLAEIVTDFLEKGKHGAV